MRRSRVAHSSVAVMESPLANSFQELSNGLAATVGVAVASVTGVPISLGSWSTGVAWSTIKVPLAVAALRADVARSDQLNAVITRSDNAAAEELWSQLGDGAAQLVQSVMREAGDTASRGRITPAACRIHAVRSNAMVAGRPGQVRRRTVAGAWVVCASSI